MTRDAGRKLTRREFDAVIRRAAELASAESEAGDALTEAEVYRIAGEVGLSRSHVRAALAEVHVGAEARGPLNRVFGPAFVHASRVVPGSPESLRSVLDEFLVATQLLQPVRRTSTLLQYRPAVDWASQIARAASFTSRKYYVASAKSVEVSLEDVGDDRTLVEVVVEPGTRGDAIAGATFGGGAVGVGLGIAAGASLLAVAPLAAAVAAGTAAGLGLTSAVAWAVGASHKKKLKEVRDELEGILDRLEAGESLEPPPASWRRWVKRNFHGVARDLMSDDDV